MKGLRHSIYISLLSEGAHPTVHIMLQGILGFRPVQLAVQGSGHEDALANKGSAARMAESAASLIGPSLEKICEAASGKKYTTLRHEAKVFLLFQNETTLGVVPAAIWVCDFRMHRPFHLSSGMYMPQTDCLCIC